MDALLASNEKAAERLEREEAELTRLVEAEARMEEERNKLASRNEQR